MKIQAQRTRFIILVRHVTVTRMLMLKIPCSENLVLGDSTLVTIFVATWVQVLFISKNHANIIKLLFQRYSQQNLSSMKIRKVWRPVKHKEHHLRRFFFF